MTIMQLATLSLEEFFAENGNGPTSGIAFVNSSKPTLAVILIYLLIVKVTFLQRIEQ